MPHDVVERLLEDAVGREVDAGREAATGSPEICDRRLAGRTSRALVTRSSRRARPGCGASSTADSSRSIPSMRCSSPTASRPERSTSSEDLLLAHLIRRRRPRTAPARSTITLTVWATASWQLAGDAGPLVEDGRTSQQLLLLVEPPRERGDLHGLIVLAADGEPEDEEDGRRHARWRSRTRGPSPGRSSWAVTPQSSAAETPTSRARRRGRWAATAVAPPRRAPRSDRSARSPPPPSAQNGNTRMSPARQTTGSRVRTSIRAAATRTRGHQLPPPSSSPNSRAQHAAGPDDEHARRRAPGRRARSRRGCDGGRGLGTSGHQRLIAAQPHGGDGSLSRAVGARQPWEEAQADRTYAVRSRRIAPQGRSRQGSARL